MHKPEFVQKNEMHKIFFDLEVQTDHQISARRPNLVLINKKKTCYIVEFDVTADHKMKIKESEKTNKPLNFGREQKKGDGDTNCSRCTWNAL